MSTLYCVCIAPYNVQFTNATYRLLPTIASTRACAITHPHTHSHTCTRDASVRARALSSGKLPTSQLHINFHTVRSIRAHTRAHTHTTHTYMGKFARPECSREHSIFIGRGAAAAAAAVVVVLVVVPTCVVALLTTHTHTRVRTGARVHTKLYTHMRCGARVHRAAGVGAAAAAADDGLYVERRTHAWANERRVRVLARFYSRSARRV